jgi:RimJ/RimL family protein N-acetyltransferase
LSLYRSSEEAAALAYLDRTPYDNAYIGWLLRTRQIGRNNDVVVWRAGDGTVAGVAYVASRIVPCADSEEAASAFARYATGRVRDPRLLVGPKASVDRFWEIARRTMPEPFARRERQPVFALARGEVRSHEAAVEVGLAKPGEADELAVESARMTSGELGYTVVADAAYKRRTARIIEMGWYWRYRIAGKLAFACHIGAETPHTAQLQGVWTPPEMRGCGHAARALAAICNTLLVKYPTVSLYVNDFNVQAIALYERVGFKQTGTLSTLIFV